MAAMESEHRAQIAFHLSGRRGGGPAQSLVAAGLRPALMAGHRDLAKLRYDFPLILLSGKDGETVKSLTDLFDQLLDTIAKGSDGERLRRHALRLELEIRALAQQGLSGTLAGLWDRAAGSLHAHDDTAVQDSLRRLRAALRVDGEVIDCDRAMPYRLIHHLWALANATKARAARAIIDRLLVKLGEILVSDFLHSDLGLSAERLAAGIGSAQHAHFDFPTLSTLLKGASPKTPLAEGRRRRIEGLIAILKDQRFFGDPAAKTSIAYEYAFEDCAQAAEAFRQRLPEMTALSKAMAVAGLEVDGRYNEARHDAFFAEYGAGGLLPEDAAFFPDYLIRARAPELPQLLAAFAAGLPAKVLVQVDDLLDDPPKAGGRVAFALAAKQLAATALGIGGVFVLQSPSSNLYRLRDSLAKGLVGGGPAIFNIYSGAGADGALPPYLAAAAALEARAFPGFVHDPACGPDLASRFALHGNPQPERDWPLHDFAYEDAAQQRVVERLPFTFADFVACDDRYDGHFAPVEPNKANGHLASVADFLADDTSDRGGALPTLAMVDGADRLCRVIVDDRLIREARLCRDMWRSLRELGGVRNSHAERQVAKERAAWAEATRQTADAPKIAAAAEAKAPASSPAPAIAEPERSSDEAYIETPRCTTCNECTQINAKMFAYNENKQAYIVNSDAGTYRQLVEAAESCQVAIIHPGKPRDPDEPGIDELLKRAAAFA
ncbi:MAG: ferredoxin [Alphaproteobacteria bacterium]|nr:ferredoxin [Alphaproteobacteria bacterium]